jgi:hypothetical protein
VVEHSTHNPNIEYSNPATDNRIKEVFQKTIAAKVQRNSIQKCIIQLLFQKDIEVCNYTDKAWCNKPRPASVSQKNTVAKVQRNSIQKV